MTEEEKKIAEAIRRSVDVRLPEDFADRLVQRIREGKKDASSFAKATEDGKDRGVLGKGLARVVLVAASVTLLLGFVPIVFERDDAGREARVAQCDSIRPSDPNRMPSDFQLNGLALFGFCREAIRRRVKPLVQCFCKRREED